MRCSSVTTRGYLAGAAACPKLAIDVAVSISAKSNTLLIGRSPPSSNDGLPRHKQTLLNETGPPIPHANIKALHFARIPHCFRTPREAIYFCTCVLDNIFQTRHTTPSPFIEVHYLVIATS